MEIIILCLTLLPFCNWAQNTQVFPKIEYYKEFCYEGFRTDDGNIEKKKLKPNKKRRFSSCAKHARTYFTFLEVTHTFTSYSFNLVRILKKQDSLKPSRDACEASLKWKTQSVQ